MRVVSSNFTWILQFGVMIHCAVCFLITLCLSEWIMSTVFALLGVGSWMLLRRLLATVSIGDGCLQVGRGSVNASMEFTNIKSVRGRFFCGYDFVHVTLTHPASFGDSFWFMPQVRVRSSSPWSRPEPHPIVGELEELRDNSV